jgi:hypothetical protein
MSRGLHIEPIRQEQIDTAKEVICAVAFEIPLNVRPANRKTPERKWKP